MSNNLNVEDAKVIDPHKEADVIPQAVGEWLILEATEKMKSDVIDLSKAAQTRANYIITVQSKGEKVGDEISVGDRVSVGGELTLGAYVKGGKLYGTAHKEAVTAILHPMDSDA